MSVIPDNLRDLFERPVPIVLVTLMPDDQPQATPVWFMMDGDTIVINTAKGRQKDKNMQQDSKVTLCVVDPQNMYHWAEARGHVSAIDDSPSARDTINKLSERYTGNPVYQFRSEGEERVTYHITIDKVNGG